MTYDNFGYPRNPYRRSRISLRVILGAVIVLFGVITYFTSSSVNPTTGESQHISGDMTPEKEMALGLQTAPSMIAQMGGEAPPSDFRAQEVAGVGALLVRKSDASKSPYQYQFHLLSDEQTINAFALPGGQIFITRGLYDRLSDEAELAGVLGHEIGHVVERHVAQQMAKGQLGNSLVFGVGVAASDRNNGYEAGALASVANQVVQLHFSRHDESQADERGLQFMTQAGFDPRAMIDVMNILKRISTSNTTPQFLQTHPDPGDRIDRINAWLAANPTLAEDLTRGKHL